MLMPTLAVVALMASPVSANQRVQRLQNVPNSTTSGSELIQGDEWTFTGKRGQRVEIRIDTRDDFGNQTSGLDPVLILKDPSGRIIHYADDTTDCSVPPVCGYFCPILNVHLPADGIYTVVARDYNSATMTGDQCNGGSYLLTLKSNHRSLLHSLTKAPSVDNGIVGDPPGFQAILERKKGRR
jgi:hypothetical protein